MIFVTGGTGLVGSHLLLALLQQNAGVKVLRRQSSDIEKVRKLFSWYTSEADELFSRIKWVEGDILDMYSLEPHLQDVELIIHCAAVVSFEKKKRTGMIHNNVEGTANLVNAALSCGVKRICHVSSNSALGNTKDGLPVTEETAWTPSRRNSGYSESKFFSEAEIWRGVEEGLDGVVVNPSIIIGPGDWKSSSTSFFPAVYRGFPFYTRGVTGFVDVRDVADAILLLTGNGCFEKAKNTKFLLSGENLSYREFFNQVAEALHKPGPIFYASPFILGIAWRMSTLWSLIAGKPAKITREAVLGSNRVILYDGSRITRLTGFRYRSVSEAIKHTAACFLGEQKASNNKNS